MAWGPALFVQLHASTPSSVSPGSTSYPTLSSFSDPGSLSSDLTLSFFCPGSPLPFFLKVCRGGKWEEKERERERRKISVSRKEGQESGGQQSLVQPRSSLTPAWAAQSFPDLASVSSPVK